MSDPQKSFCSLESEIDGNTDVTTCLDAMEVFPEAGGKVLCIVLCANYLYSSKDNRSELYLEGLVLNSTESSPGSYQRIGHFTLRGEENILRLGFRRDQENHSIAMDRTAPLSTVTIL